MMGHADNTSSEVTRDIHAHNGDGIAEVIHVEFLTDAGFGCGDLVEGDTYRKVAVRINENYANAMDGVISGVRHVSDVEHWRPSEVRVVWKWAYRS
jgi:hypothetical protein